MQMLTAKRQEEKCTRVLMNQNWENLVDLCE